MKHQFGFSPKLVAVLLACACEAALAIEDRADSEPAGPARGIAWKLTPTIQSETARRSAFDLNLRGNRDDDTFWIGHYQRGSEFRQTRAGYEHQFSVPVGKITASAQYATRGFLGGSVTLEASAAAQWVGLLGWGRTNLKPYYNLNFDPNDSVLIGAGWRPDERTALTVFQVLDDRLGTGQRVTHFVLRQKTGARTRWTFDVFNRRGRIDSDPDSERIDATGFALTCDYEPWFARVAWDPRVNFENSNMTRVAFGVRF